MESRIDRASCRNFGNIRDSYKKIRVLLEQTRILSAMFFHSVSPCLEPGGCYAITIATLAPSHRTHCWALA